MGMIKEINESIKRTNEMADVNKERIIADKELKQAQETLKKYGLLNPQIDKEINEKRIWERPLGWNIYTTDSTTMKEYTETFGKVHAGFKYKLLNPAIIVAKHYLKKNGIWKVPPTPTNKSYCRNVLVFERSYKQAMREWYCLYKHYNYKLRTRTDEELMFEVDNDDNCMWQLKTLLSCILTITLNDSAYKSFLDFLMHNIAKEMHKEYEGQTINNLLYTSKAINDPFWKSIQDVITRPGGEVDVEVKDVGFTRKNNDVSGQEAQSGVHSEGSDVENKLQGECKNIQ